MSEPVLVPVVCQRCNGSKRDPAIGVGWTDGLGNAGVNFDACSVLHGGCGGEGIRRYPLSPDSREARLMELGRIEATLLGPEGTRMPVDQWMGLIDAKQAVLQALTSPAVGDGKEEG